MKLWLLVYSASFLGNLAAWWWVFKRWKYPKIVYVPVDKDNEVLKRVQYSLRLRSEVLKKRRTRQESVLEFPVKGGKC